MLWYLSLQKGYITIYLLCFYIFQTTAVVSTQDESSFDSSSTNALQRKSQV